jgi:hypothetical protein
VLHQRLVLLLRPWPFLHSGVVAAARRPPHHTRLVASTDCGQNSEARYMRMRLCSFLPLACLLYIQGWRRRP